MFFAVSLCNFIICTLKILEDYTHANFMALNVSTFMTNGKISLLTTSGIPVGCLLLVVFFWVGFFSPSYSSLQ